MRPNVLFKRLPHGTGLPMPSYQSAGAAGIDLHLALSDGGFLRIYPGEIMSVMTGFEVAIEAGHEGSVRGRSGLAFKHRLRVFHQGTIDADYRGEILVLLENRGNQGVELRHGDRIAQLIVAPVARCLIQEVAELPATARGQSGFGSTG